MSDIPKTTRQICLRTLNGYQNLVIEEVPVALPKPDEVLVKARAVSLNYRDLIIPKGVFPGLITKDLVPCSDVAGEVVSVGASVTEWKTGDRVCASFFLTYIDGDITDEDVNTALGGPVQGVLTHYRSFPARSLVRIPNNLNFEEASTLPCAGVTAYNALWGLSPLKRDATVLVLGTGGVSILALQLAAASGATVIATSSSDKKLQIAQQLGAKHIINYRQVKDWDQEVLKITKGRGVDHIIEVGGAGSIGKSLAAVRRAGFINSIGFVSHDEVEKPVDVALEVLRKGCILRGINVGSVKHFKEMNELIASKDIHPLIDKVFPFEEAKEAYAYLESQAHIGKVVIRVAED